MIGGVTEMMRAQDQTMPQQAPLGAAVPPASLLMYLFADRFVPASGSRGDIAMPSSGAFVPIDPLATRLLAVAFWSLRQQGLLALHLVPDQFLMFTYTQTNAALLAPDAPDPGGVIERAIFWHLRHRRYASVGTLVGAMFGQRRVRPYLHVLNAVVREAVAHGYAHWAAGQEPRQESPGPLFTFLIQPLLIANEHALVMHDGERIAALAGAAEDLGRHWSAFRTGEIALFNALVDACDSAIANQAPRH